MAKIGASGIEAQGLGEWIDLYEEVYRTALGEDVSVDPATAIGRMIREQALIGVKQDQALVMVASGLNIYQAEGKQLTDIASLMGIPFREGTPSSVTVTATGVAGTIISAGSRIRTTGGVVFQSTEAAIIGAGGTVDVRCRSQRTGPIQAPIASLTEIIDVVPGWVSVTNAAAAIPGKNAESNAEWTSKFLGRVAVHGQGTLENISARVAEVPGVEEVVTLNNPENNPVTVNGFVQLANSCSVILSGTAQDLDIANALRAVVPPGVPMTGSVAQEVAGVTYRWTPAVEVPIAIAVTTVINLGEFPAGGTEEITKLLLAFIQELGIGVALDVTRLQSVATEVQGHRITAFSITRPDGAALPDVMATTLWTLAERDINITLGT